MVEINILSHKKFAGQVNRWFAETRETLTTQIASKLLRASSALQAFARL
jgi:hypothetical protein